MTDDIVTTLRRNQFYHPTSRINSFGMPQMGFELTSFNLIAADEIERLRARIAELERFAGELDASGRTNTEPAALRGTPSDGEASASEGYLHTGASVQTEKADG